MKRSRPERRAGRKSARETAAPGGDASARRRAAAAIGNRVRRSRPRQRQMRSALSTAPAPSVSYPGGYVSEIPAHQGAAHTIRAVSLATAAFVGRTLTGTPDRPVVVSSVRDYRSRFGAVRGHLPLSLAVRQFFDNGGRRAIIVRVAEPAAGRGPVHPAALTGTPASTTGIRALERSHPFGLLLTPDAAGLALPDLDRVSAACTALCERHRAIYLLELPEAPAASELVDALAWARRSQAPRHRNAAVYCPRVEIPDPAAPRRTLTTSPNGAVAGVIARTEALRGVWKAPAGLAAELFAIVGFTANTGGALRGRLQEEHVNGFLQTSAGKRSVWGARAFVTAGDSEGRYLSVRRTALMLERSIEEGMRWTRFESNGEPLWAEVRAVASGFLEELFRAGAFAGYKADDAYFVRCDASTTTEGDIAGGRCYLLIGFAALKPAEFIVLRLALGAAPGSG